MTPAPSSPAIDTPPRRIAALAAAAFVLIGATAWWLWQKADRELRADLLRQARQLGEALPEKEVLALSGRPSDQNGAAYATVKRRLAHLRDSLPESRFIYVAGLRDDGRVVFFADSELPGSSEESVAGDAYDDASPDLRAVLRDRTGRVAGPYSDSYGTWVSAFIPIAPAPSGESLALRVDMDARAWRLRVTLQVLPALGFLTLFLLVGALVAAVFRLRKTRRGGRPDPLAARLLFMLGPVVTVGILFLMALQLWRHQIDLQDAKQTSLQGLLHAERIQRLDEQLTAAAQLTAYSLDSGEWRARYVALADEIDDLLAVSRGRDGEALTGLLNLIGDKNTVLVEAERRVLELAAREKKTEALEILHSPEYRAAKEEFAVYLNRLRAAFERASGSVDEAFRVQGVRTMQYLASALIVVVASWLVILRVLRDRDRAEAKNLELISASATRLEATVRARTAELEKSERRHRLLFETMRQGVVIQDRLGAITDANSSAERILGLSFDQLRGRTSRDERWRVADAQGRPLHGDEHPSSVAAKTGRPVVGFTMSVVHASGTVRWLMVDSLPQFADGEEGGPLSHTYTIFADITERVVAERALKERTDELESFFQLSLDLLCVADSEGRLLRVNAAWSRVLGHPANVLEGGLLLDLVHPADLGETSAALRVLASGGAVDRCVSRLRTAAEQHRLIEWRAAPLGDRVFVAARDITERKQAELQLAEAAERTQLALAAGELGLWDWDIPAGHVLFDERWASIAGERAEDLPPRPETWSSRCHPEDLPLCMDLLQKHFAGETAIYQVRFRQRHRDGGWRWIMASGRVVSRDETGRPLRIVGTHEDVTAATQAGAELERRAAALAHVGRLARIGDWALEVATGDLHWSQQVRDIHEVDAAYRPCPRTWQRFYPEESGRVAAALKAVVESGEPFDLELPFVGARGRRLWVRFMGEAVRSHGATTMVRGVFQDVTESRRQREALAAARDAAEAATRAKSDFLANMSHEIRTPMNGVLGLTHLLLESGLSENQLSYARGIQASGQALLNLINDILDLSKIEAGRLEISQEVFDLHALMHDYTSPCALQARQKGLEFVLRLAPAAPRWVRGDARRLAQVLQNLLGNALKFTASGSIEVTVEKKRGDGRGDRVRFTVRDTGPGIPHENRARLFQKFSQLDASITRAYGGTGLGLAIARELCELMDGDIGVESEPGRGALFWFDARLPEVAAPERVAPTPDLGPLPPGLRVLLVEDNSTNQQVATGLLAKFGVEVRVAWHGREALDLLAKEDFALVLMDLQMPVMDGISATRAIRDPATGLRRPDLPVIGMTAHALAGDRELALAAGMSDYLTKPIHPALLHAALARWGGRTPSARTAPVPDRAPAAADAHLLDLEDLRSRMLGDEQLVRCVLASFAAELDGLLAKLQAALDAGDFETLGLVAHGLKGASANMGARALRRAAYELEQAARGGEKDRAPGLLGNLVAEARAILPLLPAVETA